MTPQKRRRLGWVLGGLTVVAGFLFLLVPRQPDPSEAEVAFLADGRKLVFQGATFGKEHTNHFSRRMHWLLQILDKLPLNHLISRRIVPNQNRHTFSKDYRITLSEPKLVLWFITPPSDVSHPAPPPREPPPLATPPRAPRSRLGSGPPMLRWKIVAPDGTAHGGTCFNGVPGGSYDSLYPICIDSYPRRLPEFTVQLFEPCAPDTHGVDAVWIGDFSVRNPQPSQDPVWTAEELPARREVAGVTCVLDRFQPAPVRLGTSEIDTPGTQTGALSITGAMQPEIAQFTDLQTFLGGTGWASMQGLLFPLRDDHQRAVASFTVQDRNLKGGTWDLRLFSLSDPTGNLSYPCSVAWEQLGPGLQRLSCSTLPLWLDDPTWKIRLQLTRSGILPTHRILVLKDLPFPRVAETNHVVLRTNILGFELTLRALGAGLPGLTPNPSLNLDHASFLLEFRRPEDDPGSRLGPMLQLLQVRDDTGRPLPSTELAPDQHIDVRHWRLSFHGREFRADATPTTIESVDLTLGFPEERTFEFLVPSAPHD